MNCPNCLEALRMADRQGIEIDYCPKCRGVWLDRGELDKIIERSMETPQGGVRQARSDYPRVHDDHYKQEEHYYKKHKRKSWLGEILDFD